MENERLDQEIRRILKEESIQIPVYIEQRWKEALETLPEKKSDSIYKRVGLSAAIVFVSFVAYSVFLNPSEEIGKENKYSDQKNVVVGILPKENQDLELPKDMDLPTNHQDVKQKNDGEINHVQEKFVTTVLPDKTQDLSQIRDMDVYTNDASVGQKNDTEKIDNNIQEEIFQNKPDTSQEQKIDEIEKETITMQENYVLADREENIEKPQIVSYGMPETYFAVRRSSVFDLKEIWGEFPHDLFLFNEKKMEEISVQPTNYQIQSDESGNVSIETSYTFKGIDQAFVLRQIILDNKWESEMLTEFSDLKNLHGENLYAFVQDEKYLFYVFEDQTSAYHGEMVINGQWIQIQSLSYSLTKEELVSLIQALKLAKQEK